MALLAFACKRGSILILPTHSGGGALSHFHARDRLQTNPLPSLTRDCGCWWWVLVAKPTPLHSLGWEMDRGTGRTGPSCICKRESNGWDDVWLLVFACERMGPVVLAGFAREGS